MSRAVFDQDVFAPIGRHGVRVLSAIVLAAVALAGVGVSVASAGGPRPGQAADGLMVDADGNAAWPSSSTGAAGEYIVQLESTADVDDVVADVAGGGVEVADT